MRTSPHEAPLSLMLEDSDSNEVDETINQPPKQVAAIDSDVERGLRRSADQETETARQLDSESPRNGALDRQPREASEETMPVMLDEATPTRSAMLAEAEALLEAALLDADREVSRITRQAFGQAREMLIEAKRESAALVDAGREQLDVLEADAARRIDELDTERQELTHQLSVMETLYSELQETLKLVAETSVKELAQAQRSLKQLDADTKEAPTDPHSELTTSGTPTEVSSSTGVATPSPSGGDVPASVEASQPDINETEAAS